MKVFNGATYSGVGVVYSASPVLTVFLVLRVGDKLEWSRLMRVAAAGNAFSETAGRGEDSRGEDGLDEERSGEHGEEKCNLSGDWRLGDPREPGSFLVQGRPSFILVLAVLAARTVVREHCFWNHMLQAMLAGSWNEIMPR